MGSQRCIRMESPQTDRLLHQLPHISAGQTHYPSHLPLTGATDSNSKHFVEITAGVRMNLNKFLVNFDVSSLFTNIPVREAVDVIHRQL